MGANYCARSATFPSTFTGLLVFCLSLPGCATRHQAVYGSDYLAERVGTGVSRETAVASAPPTVDASIAPTVSDASSPAATHVQSQVAAVERSAPVSQQSVAPKPARDEPVLNEDAVRMVLIQQSQASYSGSCPCPYNTDRAGRRCGGRSAYSKPGGASPLCYPADVSAEMVATYLARQ